jgi:hypothetical protein
MKSVNLDRAKLLIKTTYAGRRTETPLFSVSPSGYSTFNMSFGNKFFKNHKSKLFIQAVNYKNVYYLLFSKTKKEGFYIVTNNPNGGYATKIKGLHTTFGKKGVTMRYAVELVQTTDKSVYAFEIKDMAEDLFSTKEKTNFETL